MQVTDYSEMLKCLDDNLLRAAILFEKEYGFNVLRFADPHLVADYAVEQKWIAKPANGKSMIAELAVFRQVASIQADVAVNGGARYRRKQKQTTKKAAPKKKRGRPKKKVTKGSSTESTQTKQSKK